MARAGRPSVQNKILDNLDKISKLIRDGYTEEQCAQAIGVGYTTFKEYKNKLPALSDVLKKSKEKLIEDLEDTMFRKALGKCKIKTVKKYITQDTDGNQRTKVEETEQEIPPDTTLLIFSLKNLTADTGKWRDRRDVDTSSLIDEMQKSLENAGGIFDKLQDALTEEADNEL